jgi:hypothetical protein
LYIRRREMLEILEPKFIEPEEWADWDSKDYEPTIRTTKFRDVAYPNKEHVLLYELELNRAVEYDYDYYYADPIFRPLTVVDLDDVDTTIREFEELIAYSETFGKAPFYAVLDATGGREKVRPRGSGPLSYTDRKSRSQASTRLQDLEGRIRDLRRILEKLKSIKKEEDDGGLLGSC